MSSVVVTRRLEHDIVLLTLNHPRVHNCVDDAVMAALEASLDHMERQGARVVILTGAGERTFCAGGDLRYFDMLRKREEGVAMSRRMQAILQKLEEGPWVSIAAVNGAALGGGCEILLACHFRVARARATFAFRQAANGLITGWGGGARLLSLLPRSQALRLLLTGETIDAKEALRIGLVDQVVRAGRHLEAASEVSRRITGHAPGAIRAFLKLAARVRYPDAERVELETQLFGDCWVSEEFAAARRRFLKEGA